MKKTVFTGAATAIVTPFCKDGSVNYELLAQLVENQIAGGIDAIVACGTTGENATLTHDEHVAVMDFIIKKVNKRVPVIAGTGSNDTVHSLELSMEAKKSGADALLLVTPYYNKTSQAGMIQHFTYVADRVDLPIILYNVPSRTGCSIKAETFLELSKHPNIVADKEASGDISLVADIAALCGDDLAIYSGNDDQIVPILSLGGKGIISVLSNVVPQKAHDICAEFFKGNLEGSRRLQLEYLDLIHGLFSDVNPIPVKEAMNLMGINVGECRLPLVGMSQSSRDRLAAIMKKHGLI